MPTVTAKFVFKPPFSIRMLGEDACQPFTLQFGKHQVVVYPPARMEEGTPKWSADPEHLVGSIDDVPVWLADTILIDVTGEVELESSKLKKSDEDDFFDTANTVLSNLVQTCRWRTGQTWIRRRVLPTTYYVDFFDEHGNLIYTSEGAKRIQHLVVKSHPQDGELDNSIWDKICHDLASGTAPELWDELLLDARDAVSSPRRAIIDAGAACEVFIERFCKQVSDKLAVPQADYARLTQRRRTFPEYFHVVLQHLIKRSLKVEHQDIYEEIDHLYKTASSVRHEGKCQYKNKRTGKVVEVGSQEAKRMIDAARSAIEWANSLWQSNP
jgi:hypothetical protein